MSESVTSSFGCPVNKLTKTRLHFINSLGKSTLTNELTGALATYLHHLSELKYVLVATKFYEQGKHKAPLLEHHCCAISNVGMRPYE